jgi:hypothetical protein
MTELINEAERTLALLRAIDLELRRKNWRGRAARRINMDTWSALITECVFLSIAVTAAEKIEEARRG